jgi:hypothetical protein
MKLERDRLEQNLDRYVVKGYEPETRIEDFPFGRFVTVHDFIERPWTDWVPALRQAIDIHRRNPEIDNVAELENDITAASARSSFITDKSAEPIVEHSGICDSSQRGKSLLRYRYLHDLIVGTVSVDDEMVPVSHHFVNSSAASHRLERCLTSSPDVDTRYFGLP